MKIKKIPMRMCTGCMEMKPKRELIRVVKSKEEQVSVDITGKKSGRGAYVCKNIKCLEKAVNTKRLGRNLEVSLDEEILKRLKDEIGNE